MWHVIEKEGERQVVEGEARRVKGRQRVRGHEDCDVVESFDHCPCDPEGEAALAERAAQAWIDGLPPGAIDKLADMLAARLAATDQTTE